MDEEDFNEMGIGADRSLKERTEYQSFPGEAKDEQRENFAKRAAMGSFVFIFSSVHNASSILIRLVSRRVIPGPMPDELIGSTKESIGVKLLKLMGWREGYGIGPRRKRTSSL